MIRRTGPLALVLAGVWLVPAPAQAQNREHQLIMAEIRMLQEQQQQLQHLLGTLTETLKAVNARIDEQASSTRKGFADQKLLVDSLGDNVRILREKSDDTNIRLATMSQEIEALRQTVVARTQMTAGVPPPGGEFPPGEPGAVPSDGPAPPPNVSPQQMYQNAYADYAAGQYDLAILGFETYIRMFPRTALADDAQLNIGNSLYNEGKFKEAVAAFQAVISNYPGTDSVPQAYYKMGLSYERLNQMDLARKAYETVIKNHELTSEAQLAKQSLERLARTR